MVIRNKSLTKYRLRGYYLITLDLTGYLTFKKRHCPYCLRHRGHFPKDTTWPTDIIIKGDVWLDFGANLTIIGGVKVRFIPNFDDEASGIDSTRAESIVQGELRLLGNDSMPVLFTSNAREPEIGDWYGITSRFLHNNQGAVINDGIFNLVKGCEFRPNRTGLVLQGVGVYITEDARPILGIKMSGQNRIVARFPMPDTSFAVYNNTKNYILAEGNWWGTNDYDITGRGVKFIP